MYQHWVANLGIHGWLIVRWLVAQPVSLLVGQLVSFCSLVEWYRLASQFVIDVPTISK